MVMELIVFPLLIGAVIVLVVGAAWAFGDIPDEPPPPEK